MKKILDAIEKALTILMNVLLAEMVFTIFYQVILRYLFKQANVWAEELARYSFIWVVMLGSVVAIRKYQHITVTTFVDKFPAKLKKTMQILSYTLILSFLVVLFKNSLMIISQTKQQYSVGMHIPISFMYVSVAVGSFLMIVFIFENIYNEFINPMLVRCKEMRWNIKQ